MSNFLRALMIAAPCALLAAGSGLESEIGRPILDPKEPLVEVQAYTASRVPVVATFTTAAEWTQYADALRKKVLDRVVLRGAARRWAAAKTRVEWLATLEGDGYRVRKLRYEALPGLWVPALLYEPAKLVGKVPVILNVNGHEGLGTATSYIQLRCINLAKRGMLALNPEWYSKGQLSPDKYSHARINQLDLCGTSGVSVHYLSMERAIDILLAQPHADASRFAVTGLSGGGWQTIFISSLDTRVRLANPVAGYSSFVTRAQWPELDLGDSEQTPADLGMVADYAHLTAMLAPRPALLTFNAKDSCCFRADYSVGPLLHKAGPVYTLLGKPGNLRYHLNFDQGHNYGQDNREAFYRMLRDYFYPGQPFNASEIPSEKDVRKPEELRIDLPAENLTFNQLALSLAKELPRKPATPGVEAARAKLKEVVRAKQYQVEAFRAGATQEGGTQIERWKLQMSGAWTVPVVEVAEGKPASTALVIADAGRAGAAREIAQLAGQGQRVAALDPFYLGESKIATRDYLFALLVSAIGDRPLGVQASQVAAAARWLAQRHSAPVSVVAFGPRTGVIALVATALEPKAISSVTLHQPMGSLKQVLEDDMTVDKAPELFCLGLLEAFDLRQLAALAAPRPVRLMQASQRAVQELGGLKNVTAN